MIDPHLGIELRHLRYFLVVFDEQHFGRAALRLGMTRPPLARSIRALESALGVALFIRSNRRLTPTAAAEALAGDSRKLLLAVESAVAKTRVAGEAAEAERRSA
jgi:DNA-binding transcriptional LysR family regulator